jgi:hypothetical protein
MMVVGVASCVMVVRLPEIEVVIVEAGSVETIVVGTTRVLIEVWVAIESDTVVAVWVTIVGVVIVKVVVTGTPSLVNVRVRTSVTSDVATDVTVRVTGF